MITRTSFWSRLPPHASLSSAAKPAMAGDAKLVPSLPIQPVGLPTSRSSTWPSGKLHRSPASPASAVMSGSSRSVGFDAAVGFIHDEKQLIAWDVLVPPTQMLLSVNGQAVPFGSLPADLKIETPKLRAYQSSAIPSRVAAVPEPSGVQPQLSLAVVTPFAVSQSYASTVPLAEQATESKPIGDGPPWLGWKSDAFDAPLPLPPRVADTALAVSETWTATHCLPWPAWPMSTHIAPPPRSHSWQSRSLEQSAGST
jgi:hypothetical protein